MRPLLSVEREKTGRMKEKKPSLREARKERHKKAAREEETRQKTLRLAGLIEGFLEKDLDREGLVARPERIESLRALLYDNLWSRSIDPHDPDWVFDADLDDSSSYERELRKEDLEAGADTLLFFHGLLREFWEGFKEEIRHFQDEVEMRSPPRLDKMKKSLTSEEWEMYSNSLFMERTSRLSVSPSMSAKVHCTLAGEKLHFFSGSVEAVHSFINLLDGVSVNAFGKCRDESCGRWFVRTTSHRRDFCNRNCAARFNQTEKRKADPEGHKIYHREYYRKNYARPGKKKKTGKMKAK